MYGLLVGLGDQLMPEVAEITSDPIQVPLAAKPLVAQSLIAAKADAERRYPSETGRHGDTINIAGDQVVGEQPRDGLVEVTGSEQEVVVGRQVDGFGHLAVCNSGQARGPQGRPRAVKW